MIPSIKDAERALRGFCELDRENVISGPIEVRPEDCIAALQSSCFKTALLQFVTIQWKTNVIHESLSVADDVVVVKDIPRLCCSDEETDTTLVCETCV